MKITRDELQNSLEENLDLLQNNEQEEIYITDNEGKVDLILDVR